MSRGILAAVLATGLALAGCRRSPPVPAPLSMPVFNGTNALAEAQRLVGLGPRDAGTDGAANAARYLHARLRAMGAEAEVDEFRDLTPAGPALFRNVIAKFPGSEPGLIVIGGHFDTKTGIEGFEGANDSGSSTGFLLEMAAVLSVHPLPRPGPEIWLAFLDGEEARVHYGPNDGFHGSRWFARRLVDEGRAASVRGVFIVDMIGDRDLSVTLPRNSSGSLMASVFAAAAQEGVRRSFSLYPYEIGDDHDAFLAAGMPAVDLIDFYFGSEPGLNNYWHTAEDRMDKLSAESLATVGRVLLRVLRNMGAL